MTGKKEGQASIAGGLVQFPWNWKLTPVNGGFAGSADAAPDGARCAMAYGHL